MISIIFIMFFVMVPVLVLVACHRYPAVKKIGAVIICYVLGILIGNLGIFPSNAPELLNLITMVTVPLALPLLLFSQNVNNWFRLAKTTLISLVLMVISVVVVSVGGFFLFQDQLNEAWKTAGLLVGVYTGGTPNLASIKAALSVNPETYLMVHTADVIISAVFLIFVITGGAKNLWPDFASFQPVRTRKKAKEKGMEKSNGG